MNPCPHKTSQLRGTGWQRYEDVPKTRVRRVWAPSGSDYSYKGFAGHPIALWKGCAGAHCQGAARYRKNWGGRRRLRRGSRKARDRDCQPLGNRDDVEETQPLGKDGEMGSVARAPRRCRDRGSIRRGNRCPPPGATSVCQGTVGCLPSPGSGEPAPSKSRRRFEDGRCVDSGDAGKADDEAATARLGAATGTGAEAGGSRLLEDGISLGGGAPLDIRALHFGRRLGGDCGLGGPAEAPPREPVRRFEVGGDPGRFGGRDCSSRQASVPVRPPRGGNNREDCAPLATGPWDGRVDRALHKKRCGIRSDGRPRRWEDCRCGTGVSPPEALGRRAGDIANDAEVQLECSRHGTRSPDLEGDEIALSKADVYTALGRNVARGTSMHSIARRGKRTRIPATEGERRSPLHVGSIEPMDVQGLRSRLSADARERFDTVWKMTFYPVVGRRRQPPESSLSSEHAGLLVEHSVARVAIGPGRSGNVPFTVLEEKPEGLRQRFILWTRDANRWAEGLYKAKVPLRHVSGYLDSVRAECATTRDFKTGFYAIEIPEDARDLFRFRAADGLWYELCRLPMGHVCAPEIMHTLAAAAAGDPSYVSDGWAATGVDVDIFIDNIRYTGDSGAVLAATYNLDETADRCNLTWKPADSNTAAQKYTFLGVDFDHGSHEVRASEKIRRKIMECDLLSMGAGAIESLGGRLMHASAISATSPGAFWFAMKFIRRISNSLNSGRRAPSDVVRIPRSVQRELASWSNEAVNGRLISEPFSHQEKLFTVFIDASLRGWGGVIVDDATAEVTVLGNSWGPSEQSLHINVLEALALRNTVVALPDSCNGRSVAFWIDNTSVLGVARKRMSMRCRRLNDAVVQSITFLRERQISFEMRYIVSAQNPADLPSRIEPCKIDSLAHMRDVQLAVQEFLTRDVVVA